MHQRRTSTIETYFQQPCPTCGRRLLILVEHLGRQVACTHCGRMLEARDTSSDQDSPTILDDPLMFRADRLLATLERSA